MQVEILAVGTELLLGQTVNRNAAWLGSRLAEEGHEVVAHQAVGDLQGMIVDALRLAMSRSDAVIVTGGLGPTADDLTREAIAAALGVGLEFDDEFARRLAEPSHAPDHAPAPTSAVRREPHADGSESSVTASRVRPAPALAQARRPASARPGRRCPSGSRSRA